MKNKFLFLIVFLFLICLSGCGKYGETDIIKDLEKNISNSNSYKLSGILEITNNDDTYQYDVNVSFKKDDNYRVSLVNKSNNHEQVILKNSEGVYVVTPSLNKSFKFQSEWPNNNSQIYLLQSLLKDIKNDKERTFEEKEGRYIFITNVNYPNNSQYLKQKITLDKNLKIEKVEVLNNEDIVQMIMTINSIDYNSDFNDDYFDLDSIIEQIDSNDANYSETGNNEENNIKNNDTSNNEYDNGQNNDEQQNQTNSTSTIDDIIYPLYIPTGTTLSDQEKVSTDFGERIILTFDGEKPFLLVEENSNVYDEFSVIPTFGEPYFLTDTIGALSNNSITWSSNGMDYYIVSDVMSQVELIEIATSISAIPTMK
ncbi:MAG: hypothetical protein PUD59_04205 [bacterium]|nr:hypothetical protein [bacterium]